MKDSFATLLSGDLEGVRMILIGVRIEPLDATMFKFSLGRNRSVQMRA